MDNGASNQYVLVQTLRKKRDFNIIIPDLKDGEYRKLAVVSKELKVLPREKILINPLEVPSWERPQDHIQLFASTFVSENYLVGTSEGVLIQLVTDLYRELGIFDGSKNYPTLHDLYQAIEARLASSKTFRFTDVLLWLQNRLGRYLENPCFSSQFGIPFDIFRTKNLVLEMGSGFGNLVYNFTCAYIANLLYTHNKRFGLIGSRLRSLLVVDEARQLFYAYRDKSTFGESILNDIVSKSREFGLGFLICSQESTSINQVVRSLSYLKIAFPLNDAEDLSFIRKSFGLDDEQTQYLFKMPRFGMAVVRYGGFEKPFLLAVPQFSIKRKMDDKKLGERMGEFWREISGRMQKPERTKAPEVRDRIPPDSAALLFYLSKNPFSKSSDLINVPGFRSVTAANKARDWLVDNGYVQMETYRASKTKKSNYAVLQERALNYLGMQGLPGKGNFEHKLFQHIICEKLTQDGWDARVEGRMKNSNKACDVLAFNKTTGYVAIEVTLHFENLLGNIELDFLAGVDQIMIVVRDKEDQQKAEKIIHNSTYGADTPEKIIVRTIDHFFK